jgi:hypothetical protein
MAELKPVRLPPSSFGGRDRAAMTLVAIGILAAIIKPWGGGQGDRPAPTAYPTAAIASSEPPADDGRRFDPDMFGPFEPPPDWSIWPAGYFISVQYVTRAGAPGPSLTPAPPSASPGTSGSPAGASGSPGSTEPAGSAGPGPSQSPGPSSGPGPSSSPRVADWPPEIDVGPGDHLVWLGINTPRGWTLRSVELHRMQPEGSSVVVPVRRLPSRWDDHFTVIGLPIDAVSDRLADWPPGTFELRIVVDPGGIRRTIVVRVRTFVAGSQGAEGALK